MLADLAVRASSYASAGGTKARRCASSTSWTCRAAPQDGVWFADLGGLLPADQREALRWMRYEAHRDLPPGARVKRIAVTGDRLGWHVVFALEAPRAAVAKDFPTTGIDPGRSIAFTVAPRTARTTARATVSNCGQRKGGGDCFAGSPAWREKPIGSAARPIRTATAPMARSSGAVARVGPRQASSRRSTSWRNGIASQGAADRVLPPRRGGAAQML